MCKTVRDAIQTIDEIVWRHDETTEHSCVLLAGEYLRRMAFWTQISKADYEYPFFDIGDYLFAEITLPNKIVNTLDEIYDSNMITMFETKTISRYIRWIYLYELEKVQHFNLPNPYEPMIVFFERGGAIHIENGFIQVGLQYVTIPRWENALSEEPIIDLGKEILDEVDKNS